MVVQSSERRPVHADFAATIVVEGALVVKPGVARAGNGPKGDFCCIGERACVVESIDKRPVNTDFAAVVVEGGTVEKPVAAHVGNSPDGDFCRIVERA